MGTQHWHSPFVDFGSGENVWQGGSWFSFFHFKSIWIWCMFYVTVGFDVQRSYLFGEGGGHVEWSSSGAERHQAGMSHIWSVVYNCHWASSEQVEIPTGLITWTAPDADTTSEGLCWYLCLCLKPEGCLFPRSSAKVKSEKRSFWPVVRQKNTKATREHQMGKTGPEGPGCFLGVWAPNLVGTHHRRQEST